MGRSSGTFNKRENEKKRMQKRKEKAQKKEDRKAGNQNKSFEDMLAYVDENGNLTSTPPDPMKKRVVKEAEIDLTSRNKGASSVPYHHQGMVKYFDTEKGYGFIKDGQSGEEFFFHYKSADFPIAQMDRVSFETERGPKGMNAVRISKMA